MHIYPWGRTTQQLPRQRAHKTSGPRCTEEVLLRIGGPIGVTQQKCRTCMSTAPTTSNIIARNYSLTVPAPAEKNSAPCNSPGRGTKRTACSRLKACGHLHAAPNGCTGGNAAPDLKEARPRWPPIHILGDSWHNMSMMEMQPKAVRRTMGRVQWERRQWVSWAA